jgi:alkylation response protein AidB-like acyl-CoA dehydrogenase
MLYFLVGTREAEGPGREARGRVNATKLLTADASWEAVNVEERTLGGYGLDAEREFREARLYRVAPISAHLTSSCLAGHDIGLPRSV